MEEKAVKDQKTEAHKGLKMILKNSKLFDQVVGEVFKTIDEDGSGEIDAKEINNFLEQVCKSMGTEKPDPESIDSVFKELDTDKSGNIDQKELGTFLKEIFKEQKRALAADLGVVDSDEDK